MYHGEFNLRRNPTENAGFSPIDQALGNLEDHIEDAELNSPRFQAFADCTDMFHAILTLRVPSAEESKWMSRSMMEMRAVIIAEDIRKKENSVVGYKQEMEEVERLFNGLTDVVDTTTKKAKQKDQQATMVSAIKGVREIKKQAIDRKSQQPPQAK
jgi:hypothetical protein